jgi:hypothetical protein
LLYQVDGHIKVNILDTLELPVFGPTEIRFLIVAAITGQAFIDYGQPLSWFPEITGETGWLVQFFGLGTGLTFIDVCGILTASGAFIGIFVEFVVMIRRFRAIDRAAKGS